MLLNPTQQERFDRLMDRLRLAQSVTAELMAKVIADACVRLSVLNKVAARIDSLTKVGAWTDAALVLIELELPAWKLRRLVYEDGEWSCSLSQKPNLPVALDDTADARHEVLPLAILGAFLEARRRSAAAREVPSPAVPLLRPESGCAVCSDNFA